MFLFLSVLLLVGAGTIQCGAAAVSLDFILRDAC